MRYLDGIAHLFFKPDSSRIYAFFFFLEELGIGHSKIYGNRETIFLQPLVALLCPLPHDRSK